MLLFFSTLNLTKLFFFCNWVVCMSKYNQTLTAGHVRKTTHKTTFTWCCHACLKVIKHSLHNYSIMWQNIQPSAMNVASWEPTLLSSFSWLWIGEPTAHTHRVHLDGNLGGDTKHCWLRNTLMWFCLSISVCLSKTCIHIHTYQWIDLQRQNLSPMHWLTYESWLRTCFYKILFRESYLVFIKYYSNQYLLLICQNVLRITGAGFYPSSLTSLFCFNLLNSD